MTNELILAFNILDTLTYAEIRKYAWRSGQESPKDERRFDDKLPEQVFSAEQQCEIVFALVTR